MSFCVEQKQDNSWTSRDVSATSLKQAIKATEALENGTYRIVNEQTDQVVKELQVGGG